MLCGRRRRRRRESGVGARPKPACGPCFRPSRGREAESATQDRAADVPASRFRCPRGAVDGPKSGRWLRISARRRGRGWKRTSACALRCRPAARLWCAECANFVTDLLRRAYAHQMRECPTRERPGGCRASRSHSPVETRICRSMGRNAEPSSGFRPVGGNAGVVTSSRPCPACRRRACRRRLPSRAVRR
jgi:hypothetical protein